MYSADILITVKPGLHVWCEVVPYTECTLGTEEQQYTQTKLQPKLFVEQACVTGAKTVPHIKQVPECTALYCAVPYRTILYCTVLQVPECRNVTKQNCVTLWERDEDGNQVDSVDNA